MIGRKKFCSRCGNAFVIDGYHKNICSKCRKIPSWLAKLNVKNGRINGN